MSSDAHAHAVLVNPRADRAGEQLVSRVAEIIPPEDVYVSDDGASYPDIVAELTSRRYATVFTAGGDGTFNRFINHLPPTVGPSAPRIGVLACGAGNGLAGMVSGGATDPLTDLRNFVKNPTTDSVHLGLCEAEGTRFAFAGLGLDAAALSDSRALRRVLARGPLRRALQGRGGYIAAIFALTLPRRLFRRRVEVRVTNLGSRAEALSAGPGGAAVSATFGPGEVIYEGPANATVLGTSSCFGHGFRLLPFAGLDAGRFHLRVSAVAPMRLLTSLAGLRRGTFAHPLLRDFLVERVRLEFSAPVPYQLAGELMGEREVLEVGMSAGAVELVRFT